METEEERCARAAEGSGAARAEEGARREEGRFRRVASKTIFNAPAVRKRRICRARAGEGGEGGEGAKRLRAVLFAK